MKNTFTLNFDRLIHSNVKNVNDRIDSNNVIQWFVNSGQGQSSGRRPLEESTVELARTVHSVRAGGESSGQFTEALLGHARKFQLYPSSGKLRGL